MVFTRRHERELGEIKRLARQLRNDLQGVKRELDRIEAATGPLVAFIHIPKTAGGTAKDMLMRAYSRTALHNAGNYLRDPERAVRKVTRPPGDWERWRSGGGRVTAGHVPYGLFREQLPSDTRYMTFLREPVERVVSLYYRHMQRTGTAADRLRPVVTDSLEEALEMRPPELSNLATRFLCGEPSPMTELPASALDDAKANLRDFTFVGIQERFDEAIVLMQRRLGLELVPYENRHVSVERPTVEEIGTEQRALVLEHNALDVELYSFALQLFEEAVAAVDDGFAADVERLRLLSAAADEEAQRNAVEWLERELPPGSSMSQDELFAAAKQAGVSRTALQNASTRLSVKRELDPIWTR